MPKQSHPNDNPITLWAAMTTYLSYAILIVFGHCRDFFAWITGSSRYPALTSKPRPGFARLLDSWGNFYSRRLYDRIIDVFNRPITGPAGAHINLIHRRNEFRGAPHTLNEIKKLEREGKISIKTPCQLESIEGDKDIKSISIKFDDGKIEKIKTDIILSFFGLVMKLGPIAEWGLNMSKKTIEVNSENFETNKKGIFAVGDICSYPGKLKLILSGFHEVALASVECFKRARPNEKYRFEFTTSSKAIQQRLGKK